MDEGKSIVFEMLTLMPFTSMAVMPERGNDQCFTKTNHHRMSNKKSKQTGSSTGYLPFIMFLMLLAKSTAVV